MTFKTLRNLPTFLHHFPHTLISRLPNIRLRKIIVCTLIGGFLAPLAMLIQPSARAAGLSSHQRAQTELRDQALQVMRMTSPSGSTPSKPDVTNEQHLKETYGKLPLSFEANQGQSDPSVQFLSRGSGYTNFLSATGALTVFNETTSQRASTRMPGSRLLKRTTEQKATINSVKMTLLNSNPAARAIGLEELPGKINYFIGNNPEKWHTAVPTFSKVKYEEIYPV